jgi:mannose-1-phosphate guanylyltransferase/phosphomannomutase
VFPHIVPGYDAVGSLCSLLELLAVDGRTLSQVVAELPTSTMRSARIDCPWNRKGTVMRVLHERLADRELDLLDGVKARDERGTVHVIPDPQEPVVLAFAEGATQGLSETLLAEVSELVEAIVQGDDAERRTVEQASSSG